MQDVAISGRVISYALWALGGMTVALSLFVGPPQLASVGVLLAMAGAVLQVRSYICALSSRDREAFDMGRDSVRSLR